MYCITPQVKQLFFHDPDRNMLEVGAARPPCSVPAVQRATPAGCARCRRATHAIACARPPPPLPLEPCLRRLPPCQVCTCDALPLLPIETDVQLSRCHTCAAEAQRLRSSHASSGQGSAGGSSGGDLEAVCEHAAAAEECWLPVEPCAHSAASPAAEHRSTPRAQRRSSAENEEGNVMPPMPGGCCGEGEPAHSVGAVSGSEAGRCECACVGSPAAKAASGGLHSRADKDAEAEELAEMMVAVL